MNQRLILLPLALFIAGCGIGWSFANVLRKSTPQVAERSTRPDPITAPDRERSETLSDADLEARRAPAPVEGSEPKFDPTSNEPLIPERLRAYAAEHLRTGWRSARKDEIGPDELVEGMKRWEEGVLGSPANIGHSLAERRTKAEQALADAARGGGFTLLEKLDAGGVGPLVATVRDTAQFQRLFERGPAGRSVHGVTAGSHPDKELDDGATLLYPAGVFLLKGLMKDKDPFPSDITIAGAGMNATLIVLDDEFSSRGPLRNFAIRDCTLHMNDHYLFDLRTSPASMTFDRVRFTGFDSGGGCCCMIATAGNILWARDCRFEVGYGRAPWCAGLLDIRTDALLARFERCTLSRVHLSLHGIRDGATVAFVGCNLEELLDNPFDVDARPGVVFDGCSISYYQGDRNSVPSLDLNALFPEWRERLER